MIFPERMQTQIIANLLVGSEQEKFRPGNFTEPWRSVYRALTPIPIGERQRALVQALSSDPDRDARIRVIVETLPGAVGQAFPSLEEIAGNLQPIEWVWEGWIPRGMISMLGGAPAAGKSYVALDLARRIIFGESFPDGSPVMNPKANVIYVDAEVVPQLTNERAVVWDMDRSKLFLMLPEDTFLIDLSRPEDRGRLIEMAYSLQPELIIVDSVGSVTSRGENAVEDVREMMGFLNGIASEFKCGMLLNHHLRKRSPLAIMDLVTLDDLRGSSHLVAMARTVLALSIIRQSEELDRNGPRRLEVIKTNLSKYPEPVGLTFEPLHPDGKYPYLLYGDAPEPYRESSKSEQCQEWLTELLKAEGPLKPKEIVEIGEEEGFSRATIYRARNELEGKVRNTTGNKSPDNQWELCEGEMDQ
jgi:hypothetical protein